MKSNLALSTRQIRIRQWAEVIRDRRESGMKVDEYCESHGISRNAYFYWLRIVREAALQEAETEFIELKEPSSTPSASIDNIPGFNTEATITTGPITISVNRATPKELISNLLEVVTNVK